MAKLTIYEHINYGGDFKEINDTTEDLGDWRNRISSFKLADGWRATFFDRKYPNPLGTIFWEQSISFEGEENIEDLRDFSHSMFGNWNDEIVGIRLERA